jgi:hypothetical protein
LGSAGRLGCSPESHHRVINHTATNTTYTPDCLGTLDAEASYRVYLALFACLLGPFTFFNVQKTKWLQLITTVMRWTTFVLMISIAAAGIAGRDTFTHPVPVPDPHSVAVASRTGMVTLFGVSIYSFMCHHSLPSLVTPIHPKRHLNLVMVVDFALILGFYSLLCFTAVFRFEANTLEDLYTLNFKGFTSGFVAYYLGLFPVFTLSANFPIIAITLRNNLVLLFSDPARPLPSWVEHYVFPIVAIGPPIVVAFFTEDVELLVGITGSFAGVGIQYVIPALLVYYGRQKVKAELSSLPPNPHMSVFRSPLWIQFVLAWSLVCVTLVAVRLGMQH